MKTQREGNDRADTQTSGKKWKNNNMDDLNDWKREWRGGGIVKEVAKVL